MNDSLAVPVLLLAVSIPLGSGVAGAQEVRDRSQELAARVRQVFEEWDAVDAPGCAVGAARDGSVLFEGSFGLASIEHQVPITAETVFDIASMSKQFTAMAILLLESEGKLSLESEVREFVPELPAFDDHPPIRIRHLLDHTNGLRDYLGMLQFLGLDKLEDFVGPEEALELIVAQPEISRDPGDRYSYTNAGYFLLGVIVERVSGLPLPKFATQRIFEPLGMSQTLFLDDLTRIVPRRARGYAPAASGGFRLDEQNMPEVGPGGVQSSLADLLRWARNFDQPVVGTPEVIRRLTSPTRLNDGSQSGYAAGLFVTSYRGLSTIEHAGAMVGFNANLMRFPEQRFTVLALCNRKGVNPIRISHSVADVYLEEELEDVAPPPPDAEPQREPVEEADPEPPVPGAGLFDPAGTYFQMYGDASITVGHEDGRLTAVMRADTGEAPLALTPLVPAGFTVRGAPGVESLAFNPETPLMAASLELRSPDGDVRRFVRIPPLSDAEKRSTEGRYYCNEIGTTYVVAADGRVLRITRGERPRRVIFPRLVRVAADRFMRGGETGVAIRRSGRGEVIGMTVFSERDIRLECEKVAGDDTGTPQRSR